MRSKVVIVMSVVLCVLSAFAEKDTHTVRIHFDPSRLGTEARGDQTLFTYRDATSHFVTHGVGAPVLPSITVYVLMPRGARYVANRARSSAAPMRGIFDLYTRGETPYTARGAQRFPPRVVEFVGEGDLNGYRVFEFRAFPVSCQLGDGTVSRILETQIEIHFKTTDTELYSEADTATQLAVQRQVINPHDFARFTTERRPQIASSIDPLTRQRRGIADSAFATEVRERDAAERQRKAQFLQDVPNVEVARSRSAFETLQDQVFISQDNDIVYAPISF